MSQDKQQNEVSRQPARRSIAAKLAIAMVAVAAIALSLFYFNDPRQPAPVTDVATATPPPVAYAPKPPEVMAQPAAEPIAQTDKVTLIIDTKIGKLRAEFYPDKAPAVVAELIELTRSGYFNSGAVLETQPGLGFVISKMRDGVKVFKFEDELTGLSSQRGSIAISKSAVSGAYLNNLFFGFAAQPELEKHYIIIGQVLDGLERMERAPPVILHKVNGFSLAGEAEAQSPLAVMQDAK